MVAGDASGARDALQQAWQALGGVSSFATICLAMRAMAELADGDLVRAEQLCDEAIAIGDALYAVVIALNAKARIALAGRQLERAEQLAHQALASGRTMGAKALVADTLELLASLAAEHESHEEAVRLLAAADAARRALGSVRLEVLRDLYDLSLALVRAAMHDHEFNMAWAEGAALSLDDAMDYATRGRGERKRPSTGWASLNSCGARRRPSRWRRPRQQGDRGTALRFTSHGASAPHSRLPQA